MMNMGLLGLLSQMPQNSGMGGGLLDIASQFPGYQLPWLYGMAQQTPPFFPQQPQQPQGNFWQGNQFMMPDASALPQQQVPQPNMPPPAEGQSGLRPLTEAEMHQRFRGKGPYGRMAVGNGQLMIAPDGSLSRVPFPSGDR